MISRPLEYDEEFMGDAMNFVGPLEKGIQGLYEQVNSDSED